MLVTFLKNWPKPAHMVPPQVENEPPPATEFLKGAVVDVHPVMAKSLIEKGIAAAGNQRSVADVPASAQSAEAGRVKARTGSE